MEAGSKCFQRCFQALDCVFLLYAVKGFVVNSADTKYYAEVSTLG
jgi:hypothetical protein